ncbi:hypothetical protein NP233_g6818 [Leucocoprinus birnbaumii]|uniref:Protein kinase domain-containing protein n=1 Tax=Leucocoprinus birnbaumii TaxID=56174 RepID=A0AAD5YTC5_9AGAR|nr:hypothetical protein NP233_g6818 [Leucocoprinus birnbaumii]
MSENQSDFEFTLWQAELINCQLLLIQRRGLEIKIPPELYRSSLSDFYGAWSFAFGYLGSFLPRKLTFDTLHTDFISMDLQSATEAQDTAASRHVCNLITGLMAQTGQTSTSADILGNQRMVDLQAVLALPMKAILKAVLALDGYYTRLLVDFLDRVGSLEFHLPDPKEHSRALNLLSRVVASTCIYPSRLIIEPVQYHHKPRATGGSGAVYQGINVNLCVKVMIKTDHSALASWIRELILWAHSSHPNLLPFTGVFFEDNGQGVPQICLVSPFMTNGNLSQYAPSLSQKDRFPLLYDVAQGLQYLHELGIIHGDLKGQNVLITAEGSAVISDFGSSRVSTTTTTTTTTAGAGWTLFFAAPEVVVGGEKATTRSDVWSFGCLTYEILSRKRPYYQYLHFQIFAVLLRKENLQRPGLVTASKNPTDDIYDDEFVEEDHDWDSIDDSAWSLITSCCTFEPSERIGVPGVQDRIWAIIHPLEAYLIYRLPKTRAEFVEHIAEAGPSPFAPSMLREKGFEATGTRALCAGTSFPKVAKSDGNIEVLRAWRIVTNDPRLKGLNIDINDLCSQFTSKAKCDGTKIVLEPEEGELREEASAGESAGTRGGGYG